MGRIFLLFVLLLLPGPSLLSSYFYVSGKSVLLRKSPSFSSVPVSWLHPGSRVFVVSKRAGWIFVRAGRKKGWILRRKVVSLPVRVKVSGVEPTNLSSIYRVINALGKSFFSGIREVIILKSRCGCLYRVFLRTNRKVSLKIFGGEPFLDLLPLGSYFSKAFILKERFLKMLPLKVSMAFRFYVICKFGNYCLIVPCSRFCGCPSPGNFLLLCRKRASDCRILRSNMVEFLRRFLLFHVPFPGLRDGVLSTRKERVTSYYSFEAHKAPFE